MVWEGSWDYPASDPRDRYDSAQEFPAASQVPVRWLRISLDGRQEPDPEDYRGTSFTDLHGYGDQEPREAAPDEFTGVFLTGGGGGAAPTATASNSSRTARSSWAAGSRAVR